MTPSPCLAKADFLKTLANQPDDGPAGKFKPSSILVSGSCAGSSLIALCSDQELGKFESEICIYSSIFAFPSLRAFKNSDDVDETDWDRHT